MKKILDTLNKKEKINFDRFSSNISMGHYNQLNGFISLPEKRIINHYFKKGKCLDLGCGTGRTTHLLKENGLAVIGIDVVPNMIISAKKLYPNMDFRIMNACDLSVFNDESFDYILFSNNGLDYISPEKKRELCLKEIYRVLKKEGIFAFSSHNTFCLPYHLPVLKNYIYNLLKLNLFSSYKWAFSPCGKMFTHYTSPFKQKRILKGLGFKKVKLLGRNSKGGKIGTIFFDSAPYYICYK